MTRFERNEEYVFEKTQSAGVHVCSQQEIKQFYQPEIKELTDHIGDFMCIDQNDLEGNHMNLDVYVSDEKFHSSFISIDFMPCYPVERTPANRDDPSACLVNNVSPQTLQSKYRES